MRLENKGGERENRTGEVVVVFLHVREELGALVLGLVESRERDELDAEDAENVEEPEDQEHRREDGLRLGRDTNSQNENSHFISILKCRKNINPFFGLTNAFVVPSEVLAEPSRPRTSIQRTWNCATRRTVRTRTAGTLAGCAPTLVVEEIK